MSPVDCLIEAPCATGPAPCPDGSVLAAQSMQRIDRNDFAITYLKLISITAAFVVEEVASMNFAPLSGHPSVVNFSMSWDSVIRTDSTV